MSKQALPPAWTTAPERRYKDIVSPTAERDADRLREHFLQIGLTALREPGGLVLPPPMGALSRHADDRKSLHRHRYVEVGIVTRGVMTIWWNGELAQCPAGSVFVIPPGMRYQPHAERPDAAPQAHSVVWLALHRGCAVVHMCSLEHHVHTLSEYYSFTEAQVTAQARSIAHELTDRSSHFETAIRGGLLCLLTWLLRAPVTRISRLSGADRPAKDTGQDTFRDRVESYLLSHYHRPLSLAQVAQAVGCSPAYLCRHFRELTGQTPFQYLRAIRIEAAQRLLRSEVPIARVAEMVGFDDPLYFSKVFSRHTGEPPQSYRAAGRKA